MVHQGGKVTRWFINHNTSRSVICMDCQNTVTKVMDKQISRTRPPTLVVCLFVCLLGFVWLKYDGLREREREGCVWSLQSSADKKKKGIISLLRPLRAHAELGSKKDTQVSASVSWFELSDQARLRFVCCTEGYQHKRTRSDV